jgi:regulatory protein
VAEARRRLEGKGFSRAVVEATLERAQADQLLDDELFTRLWIEDRLHARPLARRAIEMELADLGVSRSVIQQELGHLYPQNREKDVAIRLASERFGRLASRNIELEKKRDRVVAFLARRGFSYSLARTAVAAAERKSDQAEEET